MLWPPEGIKAETGEVIKVISQSDIRNVYVLEKKEEKYRAEIPKTSGRFFKKKKAAAAFASDFEELKNTFGYSGKSIPVREAPDASSARVYKLRPSQMVKIVEKGEESVTVGNITGFWYKVLTDDGYEGYCFDKYLTLFEVDNIGFADNSETDWLNTLYSSKWYPLKYRKIIESGRIVVNQIKTGERLFIDPSDKKIVIKTKQDSVEFYYEDISKIDERRFFLKGTPVEINFYPDNIINIKYVYKGTDYNSFYTQLEKTIDEYIEEEAVRRDNMFQSLYEKGGYLSSDLYGSIILKRNRNFIWTGYVNLIPDIIPSGYGITGKIKNHYYLSKKLSNNYDGILSFAFDRNSGEINFVYYITDEEGLELIYIPENYIEDGLVHELPEDKKMYYFRQGITLEESQGIEENDEDYEEVYSEEFPESESDNSVFSDSSDMSGSRAASGDLSSEFSDQENIPSSVSENTEF